MEVGFGCSSAGGTNICLASFVSLWHYCGYLFKGTKLPFPFLLQDSSLECEPVQPEGWLSPQLVFPVKNQSSAVSVDVYRETDRDVQKENSLRRSNFHPCYRFGTMSIHLMFYYETPNLKFQFLSTQSVADIPIIKCILAVKLC